MKIEQGEVIKLSNGKEYLCFATDVYEGRDYMYLMSTEQPVEIRFAEQTMTDNGEVDVRIVEKREEKEQLLELFQRTHAKDAQGDQ